MSGIVGIVNLDGSPIDSALLARMTQFLAPRGPDAQRTWIERNAGLGHALLITDPGAVQRPQPFTLDGRLWITADARLDARDELLDKLRGRTPADAEASDAELILHAYQTWGEGCLDRLFGEFVFAIWDGGRRRLFCAHDQFGTRPLYFAHTHRQVIFSNTLDCVRQHPAVSSKINDAAIGDFLLFGLNYDPETTSFADIRRLPPAHFAAWDTDGHLQRCYWQMPIDEPLMLLRRHDYIDQFQSLLKTAVRERLPAGKLGISMSGGIDSSLLAAVSCTLKQESNAAGDVFAVTHVYDQLIPDQERHYSGLVAHHLGLTQHFLVMDEPGWEDAWLAISKPRPEPAPVPWGANRNQNDYTLLASLGRVYLYGEGPDNALHYEWKPYLAHLARQRQWSRLSKDVFLHMWFHHRIPLLTTLPRMLTATRPRAQSEAQFPQSLNPEFSTRLHLKERWREIWTAAPSEHPVRRHGYASFKSTLWQHLFETCDSGEGQFPLEFRHPYMNLPLLRFMLALPPLPWCRVKYILRVAAQAMLPGKIARRPKAPLAGHPDLEMSKRRGLPEIIPSASLTDYVMVQKLRYDTSNETATRESLRAVGLSHWLHDLAAHSKCELEESYGAERKRRI